MGEERKPKYTYEELKEKYIDGKQSSDYVKTKQVADDYNMIVSFLISIMLFIGIGVFLGVLLDRRLDTEPLFIIVFTFLGIGAAYRNLFKSITKHDKGSTKDGKQ